MFRERDLVTDQTARVVCQLTEKLREADVGIATVNAGWNLIYEFRLLITPGVLTLRSLMRRIMNRSAAMTAFNLEAIPDKPPASGGAAIGKGASHMPVRGGLLATATRTPEE